MLRTVSCIWLVLLLPVLRASAQTSTITGTVVEAESATPLSGVHLFLAGTTMGAVSDADGTFALLGVPSGSHQLVASHLGYSPATEQIRVVGLDTLNIAMVLRPLVLEAEGIEVAAERPRTRRRRMALFEKFFLGVSRFANECTILNPEVLVFDQDARTGVFEVRATAPLQIENRALGYQVTFVLDEFRLHEGRRAVQYSGRPAFEELVALDPRQAARWARNRARAYNGSRRHFLTSLLANRLHEDGFMLLAEGDGQGTRYSGVPGSRPGTRVRSVEPADILASGELPFERRLSFPGYLKVLYFREVPDGPYLEFREFMDRGMRATEDAQVSWIALNQSSVTVTTDGILAEPFAVTRFGYWYFERVAELLPIEYRPPGEVDPRLAFATADTAPASGPSPVGEAPPLPELLPVMSSQEWLDAGRAYRELGLPDSAAAVWARGLQALGHENIVAPEIVDELIANVFSRQDEERYHLATAAYLDLLESIDELPPGDARERGMRHLAQALLIWPEADREGVLKRPPGPVNQQFEPRQGFGRELAEWWATVDPLPASELNERAAEHLARVVHSTDNYGFDGDLLGFDDRGKAFVRFGGPNNQVSLPINMTSALQVLRDNAYALPGPVVPPVNEFWTYRHVDDLVYFVFVLEGGRYQERGPEDLVPRSLLTAYGRIGEGHANVRTAANPTGNQMPANQALATALFETWKEVYTTLAMYHPAFEEQLAELDMHESDMRATRLGGSTLNASALSFVTGARTRFDVMGIESIRRREEEAPVSFSRVEAAIDRFDVAIRPVRFLDEDGSTRTELTWYHEPGSLRPSRRQLDAVLGDDTGPPKRYLVDMVVALSSAESGRRERNGFSYLAADLEYLDVRTPQSIELTGSRKPYTVAVQWDQFLAWQEPDGSVDRGEYLRTATTRLEALQPLSSDPSTLEMSDLRPVLPGSNSNEAGAPYPSSVLQTSLPLALEFEVYHLTFDAADRTDYTVQYRIIRDPERRAEVVTSVSVQASGSTRSSSELMQINLGETEGARSIRIVVQVTDQTTGRSKERYIDFDIG